jgi:hypothetical protein
MIETRTTRPCFAVICCYASMGRHERWRGALLAEAWVWPDVLALRGSGHIREGKAMRHNV